MKAKLYITRAIKISAFILLSALVIGFLQEYVLCHHDANRMRLDAFYIEDKDTIDVAMIGSSEMYSGVSPALLYEKYGVTSFPYATASSTAAAMKTQIKEVERNQSPKLIVIEINTAPTTRRRSRVSATTSTMFRSTATRSSISKRLRLYATSADASSISLLSSTTEYGTISPSRGTR